MQQDKTLRGLIPKTVRLSRASLANMLAEFGMVYVKPDSGMQGEGVMRVERRGGQYRFQAGVRPQSFPSYDGMYEALRRKTKGRSYLVQRGVHLLKYRGRRFDLRVMVQHNLRHRWETTGILGRVAGPGKIVTNYHSGGTPLPVKQLLDGHLKRGGLGERIKTLENLGVRAGKAMGRRFPGVREVGVDVAMDRQLTPWILEVNTMPDPYIFRKLPDKSIFRKIKRYAKAYGRL